MKLFISFLGLANAKFFNEEKFLEHQKEKLELDVPFEFKSATKLLLSHYSPIIDFQKLQNHGCWCSKMNPENPHFLGEPVDELDKACKDWIHARQCLSQEGNCKHAYKAFYQSYHRYFSYTKYLGRGEWEFQMSPRMNCAHTGNHCRVNTCKVDAHFLAEVFELSKDQTSFLAPLDFCQLPSPKKLAKSESLASSDVQVTAIQNEQKSKIESSQITNDPALLMRRAFSGSIEGHNDGDYVKQDSIGNFDINFGDLDLDIGNFFDTTESEPWMSFIEDISFQKKRPKKQNCISLLTKMNINL